MLYPFKPWHNGCSPRANNWPSEILALLEQGIALCERWEALAQDQWVALKGPDLAGLVAAHAGQLQLMREFQALASRWDTAVRRVELPAQANVSDTAVQIDYHLPSEHVRRFLSAAQRVAAVNRRNARAFAALLSVVGCLETMIAGYQTAYGPSGTPVTGTTPLSMGFERQG